jgi:hypothetical protein
VKIQDDDTQLARKVVAAVKAYDAADGVRQEKAVILGGLLAEAQKLHPTDKAFQAFLERAGSIQIRRARQLIAIALGRKDFDQHQIENAAAQQRLRDKQKAEKIEREKAKAAQPKPEPKKSEPAALRNAAKPTQKSALPQPKPAPVTPSEYAFREFEFACRTYLPKLNEAGLAEARAFVMSDEWKFKSEKAA